MQRKIKKVKRYIHFSFQYLATHRMSKKAAPASEAAFSLIFCSNIVKPSSLSSRKDKQVAQLGPSFTNSNSNWSLAHSMQCSVRCGKLRSVHMGTPPPSAAAPPSRYVRVLNGHMVSANQSRMNKSNQRYLLLWRQQARTDIAAGTHRTTLQ